MKKIILTLFTTLLVFISSYADNKIKIEQGKKVLYSENSLANGLIQNTMYNSNKDKDIVIYEIYFNNGKPSGDFKLYNKEGELAVIGKGKWNEDEFEGTIEEPLSKVKAEGLFHINTDFLISYIGDNYEEIALKNIINGKAKNNNLNVELNFLNREAIKMTKYYSNGNLEGIMEFKNEQPHGKRLEYYENGNLKVKSASKEGKTDGKYLEYYENGNLKIEADFINDKLHGKVLKYDSVGNIISEEEYKNGKLIRKIK